MVLVLANQWSLIRLEGGVRVEKGWELMKIRGIPLKVHPSWFLILILFTWTAQGQVSRVSEDPIPILISWGLGLLTALLLFFSVLLHELGHSFVALNEGVKVRSITLFLMGGVARVEKECDTPMASLRVAAAGPLVSFVLAFGLLFGSNNASQISPLLSNLMGQLGSLNLVLALFNLLPGLPLDGGLILKALVWQWTGSQRKGLQVATASGRALAIFAIVLGFWICLRGGGFGGLWLLMLGWFGLATSRSQNQMLILQKVLCDEIVRSANSRRFRVLEDDQPLRRISQMKLRGGSENQQLAEWILVCRSGRWVGYVDDQLLNQVPVQQWDQTLIVDYARPISELPSIGETAPLWEAVLALERSKEGRVLVFNLAGLPCGTLDRIDLSKAILNKLGITLPFSIIQAARSQNIYPLGMALPQVVDAMLASGVIELPKRFKDTS